ncbi:MAG TPA: 6-carboxytetrahydropterin synthase [Phycisphaerales bacterium]|nr:6-carboxytetrahydropterin synthase [Phycisphaerales bacterium]
MFELTVDAEFCAAHALAIAGAREAMHGHNWRVTATVAGEHLDSDGLLCDFHTVEETLRDIVGAFDNRNLHDTPPFNTVNPTAENVARHVGDELHRRLGEALAPHARVKSVRVTEAPGCAATYTRP